MKQIVSFEQAKRLKGLFKNLYIGYFPNGKIVYGCAQEDILPAPAIGELIEWITLNDTDGAYDSLARLFNDLICVRTELIDALVSLAIKIKEVAK